MQVGKGGEKGTLHIMRHIVNSLFNIMHQRMKALYPGVESCFNLMVCALYLALGQAPCAIDCGSTRSTCCCRLSVTVQNPARRGSEPGKGRVCKKASRESMFVAISLAGTASASTVRR